MVIINLRKKPHSNKFDCVNDALNLSQNETLIYFTLTCDTRCILTQKHPESK